MSDFDGVWRNIESCADEVFTTVTGIEFSYTVRNGRVHLGNTNRTISRDAFAEVYKLMPLKGPGQIRDLVQGPSYVYGILTDDRVRP
ncbi:hypothetical protein [Nocardiopsis trehalosi]|jgi:hypothetical protein|uniref:hypothetical protein n=1 Tax=Nocardiopsis trehalosi TaxID=109329 RepID=UPI00082C6634|nr:hypothetical protein [Nocardiopsis trehalosi]